MSSWSAVHLQDLERRIEALESAQSCEGSACSCVDETGQNVRLQADGSPGDLSFDLGEVTQYWHEGLVPDEADLRDIIFPAIERLQGFPDNWTQVEHKGKPMADGPRYRMMGNAVTVNVVEWIAKRVARAHELQEAA